MSDAVTRVGKGGRVVIPSRQRKELGIEVGQEVVLSVHDGGIWLRTPEQAVAYAQELVRRHVDRQTSLVDELLRERRHEDRDDASRRVANPSSDVHRR